jgi:hypothetical protein
VPADRADDLVVNLRKKGNPAAAVVGEVLERTGAALILKA